MFFGGGGGFGGGPGAFPFDMGGMGGGRRGPVDNERYYKLLGVSQSSSDAEVKKAHRRAALQHHPDKGATWGLGLTRRSAITHTASGHVGAAGLPPPSAAAALCRPPPHLLAPRAALAAGGDEEKFKEINEAYDVLRDPEKRKMYDQVRQSPAGRKGEGHGCRRGVVWRWSFGTDSISTLQNLRGTRFPGDTPFDGVVALDCSS